MSAPEASRRGSVSFTIRRLDPDEWPRLRDLRLRALADAPDAFGSTLARERDRPGDRWRQWITSPERTLLVAERDGRLVGMASGGPARVGERIAGLYGMWVEPDARGTGMAAALAEAVVRWARERDYPAIALGVTTTNARAIALYRRLGFRDTGERNPLREGSDLVIQTMIRVLGAPDVGDADPAAQ